MGASFILTVLSEDGYQVFAALYREFDTLDRAIEGAKADYLKRYGGSPSFRVYHADGDASGYRHTLIEVCFDETKRRSFVALYKVLQVVEPAPTGTRALRSALGTLSRCRRRLVDFLRHGMTGPGASGTILAFR